jgi:hypothetical protein
VGGDSAGATDIQSNPQSLQSLSQHERRVLLGAALRLFFYRLRHNLPITKREILDLVACGDDDLESVREFAP